MKKIISTLFLAALCSSIFAQGDVVDATFLNVSFANPVFNWGKLKDNTHGKNLKKFYQDPNRYNARHFGMALESGRAYYFQRLDPVDGLRFAIAWDFLDLNMNLFRFNDNVIHYDYATEKAYADNGEEIKCYDVFVNYSMNVGPMVTYSPFDGFCIDLYGKYRPMVSVNAFRLLFFDGVEDRIYTNEITDGKNKLSYERVRLGGSLGTISCGLNVRYKLVMAGFEYITGKTHYLPTHNELLPKQVMWNQMIRFKIGLVFSEKWAAYM